MFKHGKSYLRNRKTPPENAFDVSSKSKDVSVVDEVEIKWSKFSPFLSSDLVHPCDSTIKVESVEACWQGGKFANKQERCDVFAGRKRWKKGTIPEKGLWIGGKFTKNVGKGRRLVYVPVYTAYFWKRMRERYKWVKVLKTMKEDEKTYELYDWDDNGNLDDPAPLSHAAILVNVINGLL